MTSFKPANLVKTGNYVPWNSPKNWTHNSEKMALGTPFMASSKSARTKFSKDELTEPRSQ
jgi:hypothetical protein